jgi:hypothetical protein
MKMINIEKDSDIMSILTFSRENGCAIQYSENPIKLPTNEIVFFKIEGLHQPSGVSDDEMQRFLLVFENKINTEVIKRTQAQGIFPQFYIACPYPEQAELIVKSFNMTYVDDLQIMLQPSDSRLDFQGNWDDYKEYKTAKKEKILVVNVEGSEEDGSMIQYWIENTHYGFHVQKYLCPATGELLGRDGLDGAHVEIVGHPEMGQFITPVQQGFNRSHSRKPFYVKPEYLVVAP